MKTPTEPPSIPVRCFIDANVLRGGLTTDLVLNFAARCLIEPRWSERVLDEVRRNVPEAVRGDPIDRRLRGMNSAFPRALSGCPDTVPAGLPVHPGDAHVLAAAVASGSSVLVTQNLKHFWPADDDMLVVSLSELGRALLHREPERTLIAITEIPQG